MRLPGSIEERLEKLVKADRWRLLRETDVAGLEDDAVRVDCALAGATSCIQLSLRPQDVQFLQKDVCADFALLLARGDDVFEAHIVELKRSVKERNWAHIQEQLEWAAVRLVAVAGVLDIRLHGVVAYTAFCNDKLAREGSTNPAAMKIPLGPSDPGASEASAHRWADARRSWERDHIRMATFDRDVEHRRIRADESGRATVLCRTRSSPGESDTRWRFEPVAR
ncbi:uncharacterized protein SOCE26_086540 [Sorangium cellulosum]|uniref:Uncharacterized protein n=1 Tax=Sorangium cellulosum TaxID=56 RepID=A0A2L0F6I7_SORCE|nr:hypothetical protein [Sorangium cellulosum]AUX47142.1 uncharacterized protein SOCE26_086540 [Sorangium cellulosum]